MAKPLDKHATYVSVNYNLILHTYITSCNWEITLSSLLSRENNT